MERSLITCFCMVDKTQWSCFPGIVYFVKMRKVESINFRFGGRSTTFCNSVSITFLPMMLSTYGITIFRPFPLNSAWHSYVPPSRFLLTSLSTSLLLVSVKSLPRVVHFIETGSLQGGKETEFTDT